MVTMKKLIALIVAGMMWGSGVSAQDEPQTQLRPIKLQAGMRLIDTQLAETPLQRQIGLMFRKELPPNEGMLFVFEQKQTQCFWMKNTLIPLTAAFLDDDGTIVNLADMAPQSTRITLLDQTGALCAGGQSRVFQPHENGGRQPHWRTVLTPSRSNGQPRCLGWRQTSGEILLGK